MVRVFTCFCCFSLSVSLSIPLSVSVCSPQVSSIRAYFVYLALKLKSMILRTHLREVGGEMLSQLWVSDILLRSDCYVSVLNPICYVSNAGFILWVKITATSCIFLYICGGWLCMDSVLISTIIHLAWDSINMNYIKPWHDKSRIPVFMWSFVYLWI